MLKNGAGRMTHKMSGSVAGPATWFHR